MSFLTARWRYLVMLNYEIDPDLLKPYVPKGTELDFWGDRTYVSIVGFQFLDARICGVSIPFHRNFEEVNLRFYLRRRTEEGWRRAVGFIKEIVPRFAVAAVARLVYKERYICLPMRHSIDTDANGSLLPNGVVRYEWKHKRWNSLWVRSAGSWIDIPSGSEAEFITEHYWGYCAAGSTVEYRVEHPRWQMREVSAYELDCEVSALYGGEFVETLSKPTSVLLAEGSDVTVYRGGIVE